MFRIQEGAEHAAQFAGLSLSPTLNPEPTMTDVSHISPRDKAEILAQALPYIRKFHGKTMVKIGRASCRERV